MPRANLKNLLCFVFLLLITGSAVSQVQSRWPSVFRLQDAVHRSGYIFAGRVLSIEFQAARAANEVASVRITFRVEQGLRGISSGSTLMIREWAGLWQGGPRYRVGERVVLFLHPPSKLGLTSPVDGNQGRYSIDARGNLVLPPVAGGEGARVGPKARAPVTLRQFVRTIRQVQAQE
jgi:hypothetical protein